MLGMKHIDAHKLSSEAQQHNPNQAVRLFKKGQSRRQIADNLDVHHGTVCHWIRRFEAGSKSGLELGQRGRRSGENRMLTPAQEAKLKQMIWDKNPAQMKLPLALWTRVVIQKLGWNLWHIRNDGA
jgi:transposase